MSLPSRNRQLKRQRSRNPAGEQSAGERNGLGDEHRSVDQGGKGQSGSVRSRPECCMEEGTSTHGG